MITTPIERLTHVDVLDGHESDPKAEDALRQRLPSEIKSVSLTIADLVSIRLSYRCRARTKMLVSEAELIDSDMILLKERLSQMK